MSDELPDTGLFADDTSGESWQERTLQLLGAKAVECLNQASILLVGAGGVGGFTAEFLTRAGIGRLLVVDGDAVAPSNRNRQIQATIPAEGSPKAAVLVKRLNSIHSNIKATAVNSHLTEETIDDIFQHGPFDFVIDAIDTIYYKCLLIEKALELDSPIITSLGAAGKIDPSRVRVADIWDTYQCRLGHYLRKELRRRGVTEHFPAVFSPEKVDKSRVLAHRADGKASRVGTISYMPALFGVHMSSVVINRITAKYTTPK